MSFDFVIVGGGIMGSGLAWQLARRGAEVLLLEANEIASGASGGLGKRGVRANRRDPRELPLMAMAYDLWPILSEEIKASTGYQRIGSLALIEREQDLASAAAKQWTQQQQGIASELLSGFAVREMEPELSNRVTAALFCPNDGVADHSATTCGLAAAAKRCGAVVREHTQVVGVERSGDRVTALITSQDERIEIAKMAALMSNCDVGQLLVSNFEVTLPVWNDLLQIVLTEPIKPMPVNYLIGHFHRLIAIKACSGDRVMLSGGWRGVWNSEIARGETRAEQIEGNLVEAVALFPPLEGLGVAEACADRWESFSSDGIPIIDFVPGTTNVFFATGWSGHGWAIAPAVSKLLAESMYDQKQSALLEPFRYSRFF